MHGKIKTRPVFNFYEELKNRLSFNKFEVEGLLFVEYKCPLEHEEVRVWSKSDYIVYVLSGKKTWKTLQKSWTVERGEALYIRKGANILHQYLDKEFCMLGFFISDEIIRNTVLEMKGTVAIPVNYESKIEPVVSLSGIPNLDAFYQSMLSYFRYSEAPVSQILELKAKELLMHLISSGNHQDLAAYFHSIASQYKPGLRQTMENNFTYNLKISEYADLCHRSLSSFKRDFIKEFGTTPWKWLKEKRLEFAREMLLDSDEPIAVIASESGFEDATHFSRVFKERYGTAPLPYKKALLT